MMPSESEKQGLLERLGLHRPELRAWAMYDWANSAMVTIVIATFFPLFFGVISEKDGEPVASGVVTFRLTVANWIGVFIAAVMAPILGAVADYASCKKRLLGVFMGVGVAAVGCMYFIQQEQWMWAAALFVVANIAATGSFVFYDALLPHVAREDEMDRVSTAGYALGYVGGGLLLAACVGLMFWSLPAADLADGSVSEAATSQWMRESFPQIARIAFVAVAVWWLLFTIPLLLRVSEPRRKLEHGELPGLHPLRVAASRVSKTFTHLREFRHAFLLLIAFLLYSDGINSIIRMAARIGQTLDFGFGSLLTAILMTQFIGIPFTFLFGMLAGRIGAKRCIFLGLFVYMCVPVIGAFMTREWHFFVLAALVGMVQGGTQALSRSLFASLIPPHRSGEFFGFFGVMDKFAGVLGLGLVGLMSYFGMTRIGILSIIVLFVLGALLLRLVNVEEGQRIARASERKASGMEAEDQADASHA